MSWTSFMMWFWDDILIYKTCYIPGLHVMHVRHVIHVIDAIDVTHVIDAIEIMHVVNVSYTYMACHSCHTCHTFRYKVLLAGYRFSQEIYIFSLGKKCRYWLSRNNYTYARRHIHAYIDRQTDIQTRPGRKLHKKKHIYCKAFAKETSRGHSKTVSPMACLAKFRLFGYIG